MKYLVHIFFLLFTPIASGQTDSINQLDENGLKQGLWINYYDNSYQVYY